MDYLSSIALVQETFLFFLIKHMSDYLFDYLNFFGSFSKSYQQLKKARKTNVF